MKKHAYLIMAHNNFEILEKLFMLLDDDRNDIYLHIDKKVNDFDFIKFEKSLKKSKVYFVNRHNVKWGHFSFIQAELELFKTALANKYEYYHLLSGVDLPLKNQNYIHNFFEQNKGIEFITYATDAYMKSLNIEDRLSNGSFFYKLIQRLKKSNDVKFKLGFGSNWCSLTHNAVSYIINKEDWIKRTFKNATCCDELYKQSILLESEFINNIYREPINENTYSFNMRFIKWNGGAHPYIWREGDFNELIDSHCLFARKFDYVREKLIVDKIYNYIKSLD